MLVLSVYETVLEDLFLGSTLAEGNANQKDSMNVVGLDAFKECFAMDPYIAERRFSLSISFSSGQYFHCIIVDNYFGKHGLSSSFEDRGRNSSKLYAKSGGLKRS